jgi:hypothetical protein
MAIKLGTSGLSYDLQSSTTHRHFCSCFWLWKQFHLWKIIVRVFQIIGEIDCRTFQNSNRATYANLQTRYEVFRCFKWIPVIIQSSKLRLGMQAAFRKKNTNLKLVSTLVEREFYINQNLADWNQFKLIHLQPYTEHRYFIFSGFWVWKKFGMFH